MIEIINKAPIKLNFKQKPSFELFETIKIENGNIYNLAYHQARVEFAFRNYYKKLAPFHLASFLHELPKQGLFRAKIVYNQKGVCSVSYYPYQKKAIQKVLLVENSAFEYRFKYLNRAFFDYLYKNFDADEFIITRHGFIKEFSIGNIALKSVNRYYTPRDPFLLGTSLKRHLFNKKVTFKKIHYKDLPKYSTIALLNAMVDFQEFAIKVEL